jgi:hypothetical protein
MDQSLWVFEIFRRSLDKAGMCWSQLVRVDHMCKKKGARGRYFLWQRVGLGHPIGNQRSPAGHGGGPPPIRLWPF